MDATRNPKKYNLEFDGHVCASAQVNPPSSTIAASATTVDGHTEMTIPFELMNESNMIIWVCCGNWAQYDLSGRVINNPTTGSWSVSGDTGLVASGEYTSKDYIVLVEDLDPGLYHFGIGLSTSLTAGADIQFPPGYDYDHVESRPHMGVEIGFY